MIRRSLIVGTPADWARALHVIDRGRRPLPQRELNFLFDQVSIAIDAQNEARAAALARLCRRSSLSRPKP